MKSVTRYLSVLLLLTAQCQGLRHTRRIRGKSCEVACPDIFSPVCGSDATIYSNECHFGVAQCYDSSLQLVDPAVCGLDHEPPAPSASSAPTESGEDYSCTKACTFEYLPQCGSDGVTYSNPCQFKVAQCLDSNLQLASQGECLPPATIAPEDEQDEYDEWESADGEASQCQRFCTFEYLPLCGSDGFTYGNKCLFEKAQCANSDLELAHEGDCLMNGSISALSSADMDRDSDLDLGYGCESLSLCPREYIPVCGSDGVTYPNKCVFERVQCSNVTDGKTDEELQLVHEGDCASQDPSGFEVLCDLQCFPLYDPVCGSDGVTHSSPCELMKARCHDATLAQAYVGECKTGNP